MTPFFARLLTVSGALALAGGCFSEPDPIAAPAGTTTSDAASDSTTGTTVDLGETTTDADSSSTTGAGSAVSSASIGTFGSSSTGSCEIYNQLGNPEFADWADPATPMGWTVAEGSGQQVPGPGETFALRMTRSANDSHTQFGQSVPGPFVLHEPYALELSYRWVEGPAASINVELDAGDYPQANIEVIRDGDWHEAEVSLTFARDPGDALQLLISVFAPDHIIEFDWVLLFPPSCEP